MCVIYNGLLHLCEQNLAGLLIEKNRLNGLRGKIKVNAVHHPKPSRVFLSTLALPTANVWGIYTIPTAIDWSGVSPVGTEPGPASRRGPGLCYQLGGDISPKGDKSDNRSYPQPDDIADN